MYLLAPTNSKQLVERALWFKNPIARKLHDKKGVEFGFELKGEPETVQESPSLFWGYHLPVRFATKWYYQTQVREDLISKVKAIAQLKPDYVVLHGIHLLWQPPAKEYVGRYENRSTPEGYLKVLEANIELINILKDIVPLKIENFPLTNFYTEAGKYLPYTYLYTGAGRLNDLFYIKEKTGVEILLDIEHLILTLNFLNRKKNYSKLPKKQNTASSDIEEIFGFSIQKGQIPCVNKEVVLEELIRKIGAKDYHLTGSLQDVDSDKIVAHLPIKVGDKTFRKNLRLVLAQKPETILVETANSGDNPCYSFLRPNETELSFYNLCEILLEEM